MDIGGKHPLFFSIFSSAAGLDAGLGMILAAPQQRDSIPKLSGGS